MIEIKDLSLSFRGGFLDAEDENSKALDNLSLEIPEGCIYGFLGSNGAGKSTLMRLMCGIYRPDEGIVKIDGEDVFNNPSAKSKIFFVNDETVQYSAFTVKELGKYYKNHYDNFSDETYERLIKSLDLPENKKLSAFSKGMKRQAIVAAALACNTKYIMLDEAFDGLDPAMRKIIKQMIVDEMIDRQATLIVSSHNITEISELCDRAMLIHKGKLIFADDIDEIKSGFEKIQIVLKDGEFTREMAEQAGIEVMDFKAIGKVCTIIARGSREDILTKLAVFSPAVLELIPLTLEEIFIYEMEVRGYGSIIDQDQKSC